MGIVVGGAGIGVLPPRRNGAKNREDFNIALRTADKKNTRPLRNLAAQRLSGKI
jgi:hypothetical protein